MGLTPIGRARAERIAEAFADLEVRLPAAEVRRVLATLDEVV